MRWGCKFGGLGFAGVVMPWSLLFYKSQPTKPEAPLGIRFPELEFWFGALSAPSRMNCRGFFGLLFSYPFGLFIPRVLDT